MNLIPLVELGHALVERYGAPSPGYQHVHRMISKGLLKPERLGGRLFFKTEDLPMIAEALGIAVPVKEPARCIKRNPATPSLAANAGRGRRVGCECYFTAPLSPCKQESCA